MVTIAYGVAILFMVLLPLIFAFMVVRKYGVGWTVFMLGGVAFLVAEIVRSFATNWLTTTDFFVNATAGFTPVYVILVYAVIISLFYTIARYAGFRVAGSQGGSSWGGAMTVAAGFATLNIVLIFGLNALMTLVYVLTFPATAPDGVTAAEFATMQQQIADFWNLSFISAIVQSQLIPGLWQFTLQFAITMVAWVGVVQKKWLWIFSAFLLQTAMVAVYSVVSNWMLIYLVNAQEYSINFFMGTFIFLLLAAFNVGIVYVLYKKVKPLVPEFVRVVPAPMPAKSTDKSLPAKEKPAQEAKPAKKLKNTDLK
jgi:uncharacterized membrane protein YhfC